MSAHHVYLSLLWFALVAAPEKGVFLALSCQAVARFSSADLEYSSRCYGVGEW